EHVLELVEQVDGDPLDRPRARVANRQADADDEDLADTVLEHRLDVGAAGLDVEVFVLLGVERLGERGARATDRQDRSKQDGAHVRLPSMPTARPAPYTRP